MSFKLVLMKQGNSKSRLRRPVWWVYKLWSENTLICQDAWQHSHSFHRAPWQNYLSCPSHPWIRESEGKQQGHSHSIYVGLIGVFYCFSWVINLFFSMLPRHRIQTHPFSLSSLSPSTSEKIEISFPKRENFISWKTWQIFQEIFENTLNPAKTIKCRECPWPWISVAPGCGSKMPLKEAHSTPAQEPRCLAHKSLEAWKLNTLHPEAGCQPPVVELQM